MAKCLECGRKAEHEHHIIPKARGGTATVPLCNVCHGLVHMLGMRANHRKLSIDGTERRRREGKVVGGVPYGYRISKQGKKEKDPGTYQIVRMICGHSMAGLASNRIAQLLNQARVPTPMGKGKWWDQTVFKIITREGGTTPGKGAHWKNRITEKQKTVLDVFAVELSPAKTAAILGTDPKHVKETIRSIAAKNVPEAARARAALRAFEAKKRFERKERSGL